jgi:hypothetical protein
MAEFLLGAVELFLWIARGLAKPFRTTHTIKNNKKEK